MDHSVLNMGWRCRAERTRGSGLCLKGLKGSRFWRTAPKPFSDCRGEGEREEDEWIRCLTSVQRAPHGGRRRTLQREAATAPAEAPRLTQFSSVTEWRRRVYRRWELIAGEKTAALRAGRGRWVGSGEAPDGEIKKKLAKPNAAKRQFSFWTGAIFFFPLPCDYGKKQKQNNTTKQWL